MFLVFTSLPFPVDFNGTPTDLFLFFLQYAGEEELSYINNASPLIDFFSFLVNFFLFPLKFPFFLSSFFITFKISKYNVGFSIGWDEIVGMLVVHYDHFVIYKAVVLHLNCITDEKVKVSFILLLTPLASCWFSQQHFTRNCE